MHIYFESWPEGKIKVFASENDPGKIHNNSSLAIFESDDSPFGEEIITFQGKEYFGRDLELLLEEKGLTELNKRRVRSLCRFILRDDLNLLPGVEQFLKENNSAINHPLDCVDGIEKAVQNPERRGPLIHLDIISPSSLEKIRRFIGEKSFVPWKEGVRRRKERY